MEHVLVTTKHRGVFFGQLKSKEQQGDYARVVLVGCRNCISWESSVRGFLGLAADGPDKGCRVGPEAVNVELWCVTSVVAMTPEAVKKVDLAPWK